MNKKIKILILISVLLNLFLAGVVAGQSFNFKRYNPFSSTKTELLAKLPKERRAEFKNVIDTALQENKIGFSEMKKLREESLDMLTAEKFDGQAYKANIDRIATLRNQQMERMANAVIILANSWSPTERKALAKLLQRGTHFGAKALEAPLQIQRRKYFLGVIEGQKKAPPSGARA